ncbi:uncharacterized protein [Typha latifolia]|uniref:uncharacterized protein n=1 Tax=Typha latifolia TaxID=4733 RepID=UPI003C2E4B05
METYKGGLKGYWKQRAYHGLDGAGSRRPRRPRQTTAELGGGRRRRRFWRIKISPKLKLIRFVSPRRWLAKIRDAYVRMMLGFASSAALGSGFGYGYGYGGDARVEAFSKPRIKEYDEKMLVEIYKSIIAQGSIGGADAAQIAMRR